MEDGFAKRIGKRIKIKRKKDKINQKELAEKVGISASAINQFEKGEKKPSSIVLAKIARVLDVSTDYLIAVSDDEGIFVGKEVSLAFRDFKELKRKDRDIILDHIEYLKSKTEQKKQGK